MNRKTILFVSENVTLAQVVRLVTLAKSLDPSRYEVHFASSEFPELVFGGTDFVRHTLVTLPAKKAQRALDKGKRLYERSTLLKYIDAELELYARVKPDLAVGDFRLSLSTSAELAGVPCGVLINAYWSPFAPRDGFPVPDHPIIKLLGERLTAQYFPQAIPKVFKHFAAPLNEARKKHGLAAVGGLLEMLTHGDYTLYADDPVLTPVSGAPDTHRFLGPVLWEPDAPPVGLDFAPAHWPLIYATLGSSGRLALVPGLVQALTDMPVRLVLATAARTQTGELPPNMVAKEFVAGSQLARDAALVITNGGSSTGYQALTEGTPVLGLPSNFDQFLATEAITRAGAGAMLKARTATATTLRKAITDALVDTSLRHNAKTLGQRLAAQHSGRAFNAWVTEVTGS